MKRILGAAPIVGSSLAAATWAAIATASLAQPAPSPASDPAAPPAPAPTAPSAAKPHKVDANERVICKEVPDIGSRINHHKECRTKQQWDDVSYESGQYLYNRWLSPH